MMRALCMWMVLGLVVFTQLQNSRSHLLLKNSCKSEDRWQRNLWVSTRRRFKECHRNSKVGILQLQKTQRLCQKSHKRSTNTLELESRSKEGTWPKFIGMKQVQTYSKFRSTFQKSQNASAARVSVTQRHNMMPGQIKSGGASTPPFTPLIINA